jgi:hypothetical protein
VFLNQLDLSRVSARVSASVPQLAVKSLNSKVTTLESELAEIKQTLSLLVSRTTQ